MKDRNWLARQKLQKKIYGDILLKGAPVAKFISLWGEKEKKKKSQTSGIPVWLLHIKQNTVQLKKL